LGSTGLFSMGQSLTFPWDPYAVAASARVTSHEPS